MQDKYVNPFTDFGFKKLFGEEPHKELLISFLNTLLPEKHQIQDLQYTRNEQQGYTALDDSLKYYRDLKNVTDTAWEEGLQEGIEQGERNKALTIAHNLLDVLDDTMIALKTGLSVEDVQKLRRS
jgi:hypothetical protein